MAAQVELLTGLVNVAIPEVYQKGMSYYEVLTAVVNKVNELIKQSNEYFSESVQSVMTNILIGWKDDGTLDALISEAVLKIGDRQYTEHNYVTDGESVTDSIDAIDTKVASHLESIIQVNVKSFGAIGNKLTDDTISIKNAITHAVTLKSANKKPKILFPSSDGYKTTEPIVIPDGITVLMDSPIIYYGSSNIAILTIGSNGLVNFQQELKLDVMRDTQSDWSSEDNIGIKLINCNTCDIKIIRSQCSTIGVQTIGSGAGFVHNEISLFTLLNNKIGLDLTNENQGWCNENNWYGGRFGNFTGANDGISRYGVRVTSKSNPIMMNDNNAFLKPSFEINRLSAVPGEAIPVIMEHGQTNSFVSCRSEGNSTTFARVLNQSTANVYNIGFGTFVDAIDNQSANPTDTLTSQRNAILNASNPVFNSGALHKKACMYNATAVNIPNLNFISANNDLIFPYQYGTTINPNYIEITNQVGVGTFIGTQRVKRFVLKKDVDSGYGGKVIIKAYDTNGVKLTSTGAKHPYVQGASFAGFAYFSEFGGAYQASQDDGDIFFKLKDEVGYIEVAIARGSNPLRIRSFSVHALDRGWVSAWTGYEEMVQGSNLASQIPTTGTWQKGKIIYNDNPTPGGYIGWVCTVTGTPGTWKGFGSIQA